MKCISKKKLLCCMGIAAIFISGCSNGTANLNQAYDVYETGKTVGISTTTSEDVTYFADNLCVSEDTEIGTDATDASVAEGAGVFNLSTNTVTYAKNLYEKLYPASTTKILTAYIALKYCDLNEMVTVSENAANQSADSSICGVNAGDVISMRYLLYGLMLRSGNDAAIAIAEHISGDTDSFATLMNQEAKSLGATNSNFVNPNGLPDENHYTTIYDMYLIFQAALQNQTFVDIISTQSMDVTYYDGNGEAVSQNWSNTNQYLLGKQTAPNGITVVGGKTGTTGDAGYCLVLYSYNAENQPIISIVFKADCKSNLYLLMNEMLAGYTN